MLSGTILKAYTFKQSCNPQSGRPAKLHCNCYQTEKMAPPPK